MKKFSIYHLILGLGISFWVSTTMVFAQTTPQQPAAPAQTVQQPNTNQAPATIYRGPDYVNVTPFSSFGAVSVTSIINNLISYISAILAMLAVGSLVYGGVLYMTAGGDNGRIGKAKQVVVLTFVGLVLASFAYMIVVFATRIFYGS